MTDLEQTKSHDGAPPRRAPFRPARPGPALALILAAMVLGAALDRLLSSSGMLASAEGTETGRIVAQFIRQGSRIVVPAGSPLRGRLVVAPTQAKEVARILVLPAVVEADPGRTVKVLPPVAGRVVSLKVQLGERVAAGQELLVLDSGDLAQAFSDDEKARTELTLTKQALDRQLGLEKSGGAAIKDREQAESDYAQAQAEFERAETRLRSIGVSPEQMQKTRLLTVKAPMAGSVIDLDVAPGAFLNDFTAAIMTIANLETVWVTASVPEKDTAFVSDGQSVSVSFPAYPGEVFDGKVLFVSDVLDPDTRRTKVRVAFDNPAKAFKPGMFANATFAAPTATRLVVPTSALLMSNDSTSVFVEVAPWTFERRVIETAYQEDNAVAVKSGLSPGDKVIVQGAVLLND